MSERRSARQVSPTYENSSGRTAELRRSGVGDPVGEWTRSVRMRLEREHARSKAPALELQITLGFVVFAALVGALNRGVGMHNAAVALGSAALAFVGLACARTIRSQRRKRWKKLAWAWIGRRDPFLAHGALLRVPADEIDVHLLASYLVLCNRVDEAVELLVGARSLGHRKPETTKLLIDLLFRRGEYDATLALVRADVALLSARDRESVELAVADQVRP